MKKLTKSKMKRGEIVYEKGGYFYLDPPGVKYELLSPIKSSEVLSFIPDCEETDEREKNCSVFVKQKWSVKNLATDEVETIVVNAYLSKWFTAWTKYNHIVSKEYIYEDENEIE